MFSKFNIANSVLVGMAQAVSVHPERCNRMCHKSSTCSLCETNCPVKAIKVGAVGTTIHIDWDKCTYCGICVNICPTGVYGIREQSYASFLNTYVDKITEEGILKLSCKKVDKDEFAKMENPPVLMECLGILGLPDILYFYTRGAKEIYLTFPGCAECQNKYGREIVEDELVELKKLIPVFEHLENTEIIEDEQGITIKFPQKFQKPESPELLKKQARESEAVSRREIFSLARKNATDTAMRSAVLLTPQELPSRTPFRSTKEVPVKRKIFLDCITNLGKLRKTEVPAGPYFYSQTITDECRFCKICARFCHSGALFADEEGGKYIKYNPSKCTSCGMCKISCYYKYIKSEKTVDLRTFFDDNILYGVPEEPKNEENS